MYAHTMRTIYTLQNKETNDLYATRKDISLSVNAHNFTLLKTFVAAAAHAYLPK